MIKTIVRSVVAIAMAIFVALLLIIGVELFSAIVHPVPDGFQGTPEEMCLHVERYPQWVLAVVVPLWALTTFVSIWLARRIANVGAGSVVGLLLLVAVIFNVAMLPYPVWFKVMSPVGISLALAAGLRRRDRAVGLGTVSQ